jgi:hypothetical protein
MGIFTLGLLVYTKLKKRSSKKHAAKWTHASFQPSVDSDDGKWARASLKPPPRTMSNIPQSSSHHPLPPISTHPIYTEQSIDFTRIGTSREGDKRQRLHSIVSTLSNHHLPANPSSEALDHFRADRIGSIDDTDLLSKSGRPSMATIGESGRKKSGTSTLGTLNDPSVTSFTIERARRASLSVRKVSVGGVEEVMPYTAGAMTEPTSPVDLDVRFAKPISVLDRPPSQIDFTQPVGTPRRQGDHLIAAHNPLAPKSPSFRPDRDSLLPPTHDLIPPQQLGNSPCLQRPLERERLPMIDVSPMISPSTFHTPADPVDQRQSEMSISTTTPTRSGSKKKKRPDSIILAHLRSPKLGGHLTAGNRDSTDSPPPISDALNGLSAGIATSVLAMKSAGGSTNFPYSLPPSASSGSRNEMPKTPRTATSEGCQSAMSDIESAELFQAWKGFAPPIHVAEPVPAIKRGLSVQASTPRLRPKAPRRAGTKDGDIDMEIVLNGDNRRATQPKPDQGLSVSRPVVILTPNTAKEPDFSVEKPGHTKRASLTPSVASGSSSTSSKSKITYLADVVREESRLSTLSVISA